MTPLLPNTTVPSASRKARAALRLWRVVECPHPAKVANSWLRLTGLGPFRSAERMYSIVSRVGLAPELANWGDGDRLACAIP
jgi:hypothetical protein